MKPMVSPQSIAEIMDLTVLQDGALGLLAHKLFYIVSKGDDEQYMELGIYSSRKRAEAELARISPADEFNAPDGCLAVSPCRFDDILWSSGFGDGEPDQLPGAADVFPRVKLLEARRPPASARGTFEIFSLRHTIVRRIDSVNHKALGLFPSEARARDAVAIVAERWGFRDRRGFFSIKPSLLDVNYGFAESVFEA